MANAVVAGDAIYGLSQRNRGQFFALDAKTGRTLWTSPPRQGANAAIVSAGDFLFLLKDDAELIVARRSVAGFERVKAYTVADTRDLGATGYRRQPDLRQGHNFGRPLDLVTVLR